MSALKLRLLTAMACLQIWSPGAQAQEPLVIGIDHIPVVVRDLEKAQADFRAMGFAIKPGRFHPDGIRNAHVKFPDGTEIELITAPKGVDELTSEYRGKMEKGEGPVYFGLYAPDSGAVRARFHALGVEAQDHDGMFSFSPSSPLHPLFLGQRNKAPTDKPEHFAHPNSAVRLSALWVSDRSELRELLQGLGVPLTPIGRCGVIGVAKGMRAALPEGNLYLVPSEATTVLAARVEVRRLEDLEAALKANGVPMKKDTACDGAAVWVPLSRAHGIWIEFAAPRAQETTGGGSETMLSAGTSYVSSLCVQVNPYGEQLGAHQPDDGRVRLACRQLLGKPALPLARIIVREHVRRTAVPAGQDSVAQLQSDSWVFREIPNVVRLHPVFSDDPELVVHQPVAHRCASRLAGLATYGLKESAAWHCQASGKQQLVRNVEDILPQGMDKAAL